MKLLKNLMIICAVFATTAVTSTQKDNAAHFQAQAVIEALKKNDSKKVENILQQGPKTRLWPILSYAIHQDSTENVKLILDTNIQINGLNFAAAVNEKNLAMLNLLIGYTTKEILLKNTDFINKRVKRNNQPFIRQDFIGWIRDGSSLQNLSQDTIKIFAQITISMKHFYNEFENLLALINVKEYNTIFIQRNIDEALDVKNYRAIELLTSNLLKPLEGSSAIDFLKSLKSGAITTLNNEQKNYVTLLSIIYNSAKKHSAKTIGKLILDHMNILASAGKGGVNERIAFFKDFPKEAFELEK